MSDKLHIPDEQIVAFVCGTMTREERATLASRMVDDAELAGRVEALRRMLAPLDAWRAPEPAAGAVDAIMERVARTTPLAYVASTTRISPPPSGQAERRSRFTLAQFFAVAASIAIVLQVVIPTVRRYNDTQLQTACLTSMGRLAQGNQLYSAAYDGWLPRAGFPMPANFRNQPQRQNYAPALQLQFVMPRDLFCPSSNVTLDDEAVRRNLDGFFRRTDIRFFTVQHPAGGAKRWGATVRMPVAGDESPLFPNGEVKPSLADDANSPAHRWHGQNVLFSDGSVEFLRSPQLPDDDNIWRPEAATELQGTETPVSATDSFLIP